MFVQLCLCSVVFIVVCNEIIILKRVWRYQRGQKDKQRSINLNILQRRVWRYQRGHQNPYIEEEQTTKWETKKYKRTNNDLQNIHIKTCMQKCLSINLPCNNKWLILYKSLQNVFYEVSNCQTEQCINIR
jgi:hypothetical protein